MMKEGLSIFSGRTWRQKSRLLLLYKFFKAESERVEGEELGLWDKGRITNSQRAEKGGGRKVSLEIRGGVCCQSQDEKAYICTRGTTEQILDSARFRWPVWITVWSSVGFNQPHTDLWVSKPISLWQAKLLWRGLGGVAFYIRSF